MVKAKTSFSLIALFICLSASGVFGQADSSIIDVAFCDLLKNPNNYSDKLVRVKATYIFGFESSVLYCSDCLSEQQTWVEFDESYVTSTKKKFRKKLSGGNYGVGRNVNVTFIGRFQSCGGCGHFGIFPNKFTVKSVENAEIIYEGGLNYQALPENVKPKTSCRTNSVKAEDKK